MDIVDFGASDGEHADNVKDFLNEQLEVVADLLQAVVDDPDPKNEPFSDLMSYVKGAAQAMEEAVGEAWPELRDRGAFSKEVFDKVSMTGALCGVLIDRSAKALKELRDGPAMLMLITMVTSGHPGSPDLRRNAVTTRALADELRTRAMRAEEDEA